MSDEQVEDVAKAIWDARRAYANNAGIQLEYWGDGAIPRANGIMDEARAAIAAYAPAQEEILSLPEGWTQQKAAKAAWMIYILAQAPAAEWLSRLELHKTLEEFRAISCQEQKR